MDDIRIPVNFFFHKKTLALFERFGDHGYVSLIRLYIFARVNRSTGDLSGIPDDQLEFMAMWKGEKGAFISALVEFGLADRGADGSTRLHNWSKHQAWAIGAPKRSEAASVAAKAKWEKELERKINAARNADGNADGNAHRIEVASKPHDAPILSPPLLSSPPLPSPNLTLPLKSTEGVQGDLVPPATPAEPTRENKKPCTRKPRKVHTLEELVQEFESSPAYKGIDIRKEALRMTEWIKARPGRTMSRMFMVNWLNKIEPVIDISSEQVTFKEESVADRIRARDLKHAEECRAEFADGRDCMAVYGCGQDRCYVCPIQLEKWSGAEEARAMRRLRNS